MSDLEFDFHSVKASAQLDLEDAQVLGACAKTMSGELGDVVVAEELPAVAGQGTEALQRATKEFILTVKALLEELSGGSRELSAGQEAASQRLAATERGIGASFDGCTGNQGLF